MDMRKLLCAVLMPLVSMHLDVMAAERFIERVTLPTGQTVVVADGDFEARCSGSFSVRLYDAAPFPDETTFVIFGLIHRRDGVLEKILLADVDGDSSSEILVVARSVGTCGYLPVYGFKVKDAQLAVYSSGDGLPAGADPVESLKMSGRERK